MAFGWIAGIGSILGGAIGAGGAETAAGEQAAAAERAEQIQQTEFNTITGQESPFLQSGYGAQGQLNYLLGIGKPGTQGVSSVGGGSQGIAPTAASSTAGGYGSLLTPFTAQYMQQYSPAYQFQLQQGQQGVLNADNANQGSLSGAALKDLTSFNQNYANTAFNNAFNQYQTQLNNTYSRLGGVAQLGQTAAANTGAAGVNLASAAGQAAQNVGTALAGGTVGAANALGGSLNSLGGIYAAYGGGWNPYVTSSGTISGGGGNTLSMGDGYTDTY